jgi:SAM-dependent methyltransferase
MTATADARAGRIAALGYDPLAGPVEAVRTCNLCGSSNHVEVARRDRYGYGVRFRTCARCGLGFLSPRPTAAAYASFYDGVYRPLVSAYHGRRIDAETVQEEQRDYAVELAEFLEATLPGRPATVLDVGGSTGVVAQPIRDAFAARVTVLDPAPDELAVAAANGMETIQGFAETADLDGRSWDLVLLCQTIDHLLDVAATLRVIRSALATSGCAFVDVLDVGFMMRRRGSIEGAVKVDHPYYLTRDTALAYFARAGLEPVAERLSDDGHWGFVLAPGEPREPDWGGLRTSADAFLDDVWRLRAAA